MTVLGRDIKIIDGQEHSPIQGATVIGKSGLIIGITDSNGRLASPEASQYPLSIRNIGYEPTILSEYTDTVRMSPAVYSLNEVVVNSDERPIQRVVCFAREYATGATGKDTLQLYSEYMLESFLKDGSRKIKGYKDGDASPKVKNLKRYARFTDSSGLDSIMRPKEDDEITMLSWKNVLSVPNIRFQEKDVLREGKRSDTIPGKYWPKNIIRKLNGIYTVRIDRLSDSESHSWSPFFFKLLGMTIEIVNLDLTLAYKENESGTYSLEDFIYSTYSIHTLAKGKVFKWVFHTDTSIDMDAYIELYPVSIEYLTQEEYKAMRSEKEVIPFETPLNLQPLPESVVKLVERVDYKQLLGQ